jgi:hypothetical protein
MPRGKKKFVVYYRGTELSVEVHEIAQRTIYLVRSARMEPLLITRITEIESTRLWASIPMGREKEAEVIGRLIDRHAEANQ